MSDSASVRTIRVLDTTLRDGDQSAYGSFSIREKLAIARLLDAAGVDCVETGFPASSAVDLEACRLISAEGLKADIAVMCRAIPAEIELAASVLPPSNGIIHLTLPVSDTLMGAKLGKTKRETLALLRESVRRAADLASLVEMGAEDATRADYGFLVDYCAAAIEAGARIVNIADTVGKSAPEDFAALIRNLVRDIPAFASGSVTLSVHCHNDMGLASANSRAGLLAGADQIETTLLGIGERAGNAATEELAAIIALSGAYDGLRAGFVPEKLADAARTVGVVLGLSLSPFKPIIGQNARVHSSGTHQQAETRQPGVYEVVPPSRGADSAGSRRTDLSSARIVLSRHSGRAGVIGFAARYASITLGDEDATAISTMIKELPDAGGLPRRIVGITEFLEMLRLKEYDVPVPWKLRKFTYKVKNDGFIECRATVACAGENRRLRAAASNGRTVLVDLASNLCPTSINLLSSIESSVYTDEGLSDTLCPSMLSRVYVEAVATGPASGQNPAVECSGRPYCVERIGFNPLRQLFECMLDVVNAERCICRSA
jgi:2-isopropylmalate synthase